MAGMSRGVPAEPRPRFAALYGAFERLGRLARVAATIVLPAGAAIAVLAVATDSSRQIDIELHLIAPDQARPGEALPIRALLFRGLRRPEGAELARGDVEIALRARDRRVIARTRLSPSFAQSLEGALRLPASFRGSARIEARAQSNGETAYAERWLWIDPGAPGLAWHARDLAPLQSFAAAPVRVEAGQIAPAALDARVAQGACVPEQTCELLVHVGEPAAALRALASASAVPDAHSAQPSPATSGVVRVRVTTHGPEAQMTLRAERAGDLVATRALRLPVALGMAALRAPPRVLDAPARPRIGLASDERGCIADAFLEQRWLHSAALRACRDESLPFELAPGLWRLQLRRDPFASESASAFAVYVRGAGEDGASVLRRIAAAALQRDPHDALAQAVAKDPSAFGAELEPTAAYLLAVLDAGVIALPPPVSSYPRAVARALLERERLRALSVLVLAACAVALGLLVLQRGLRAAAEASRVMEAAGEEPRRLERQRARMALHVLATVTSLLLAFVAIAVYMIVRGRAL
jgi:hypothetical protein